MKFEIGEIVEIDYGAYNAGKKAVLLQFNADKVFGVQFGLVKIMFIGESKPTYTLLDRARKL
jgi:hypothetical protein